MISIRLCVVAVLSVGLMVNANAVIREQCEGPAEPARFQVFIACQGSEGFNFGAGIPITRSHVLTAAELVFGFLNWSVAYGSNALSGLQYIESSNGFVHPSYNATTFNNNLGIIVLPSNFPGDVMRPIALPSATDAGFPRVNQEGIVAGFGVIKNSNPSNPAPIETMKTVYLNVTDNCATQFRGTDVQRNFCASDSKPNSLNLCQGDLGSAFVVIVRGEPILAGLTSVISVQCKSNEKVSFTRIQSYLPWIQSVTRNATAF